MKATCGGCDNTWAGETRRAHCSACHFTFANPRVFDMHRYGDKYRRCRRPGVVGLHEHEGTWYDVSHDETDEDA
jgi:hypothetical protein